MRKIIKHLQEEWFRYGAETLVVIIGVLIAFSLNNWNERLKDRKKEQVYLTSLRNDMMSNKSSLQFEIDLADVRLTLGSQIKDYINGNMALTDTAQMVLSLLVVAEYTPFHSHDPTYDDLNSSGNIDLIQSSELKNAIREYFYRVDLFSSMLYASNQAYKKDYYDVLYQYVDPALKAYAWKIRILETQDASMDEIANYRLNLEGLKTDATFLKTLEKVLGEEGQLKVWYEVLMRDDLDPAILRIESEID